MKDFELFIDNYYEFHDYYHIFIDGQLFAEIQKLNDYYYIDLFNNNPYDNSKIEHLQDSKYYYLEDAIDSIKRVLNDL